MKKIKVILAAFLLLGLVFPKLSYAHGSGFPPFFKIDGTMAAPYFLQNAGVFSSNLAIPQDIAPKNFSTKETINFEIDKDALATVYPPEILDTINYNWNFGDGAKAKGLQNSHEYKKSGSYVLTISAHYKDPNTPDQLIESALINVVPSKDYHLPTSIIKVNGKRSSKANYNIIDYDLANSVSFDGSDSYSKSSSIVKYAWDFGDDKAAEGVATSHQYELPQAFATVVLRVYDANGFFTDSYVNVRNSEKNDPNAKQGSLSIDPKTVIISIIVGIIVVLIIVKIVLKKKTDKRK